jgi:hypothetical protein
MQGFAPPFRRRSLCGCLSASLALVSSSVPSFAMAVSPSALALAFARVRADAVGELLVSTVTDCSDSPSGPTLRYLATHAYPGASIDIGSCPTITLAGGILTPLFTPLTITGNGSSTIVASAVEPALAALSDLTLANLHVVGGRAVAVGMDGFKKGGAVVAAYGLTLINSTISGGDAGGIGAKGGAIYAYGDVTLQNSTVTGARAVNAGGCIYGRGSVVLQNSTVSECRADAYDYLNANITATGGAIAANSVTLENASHVIHGVAIGSPICVYGGYNGCYTVVPDTQDNGGGIAAGTVTCTDSTITGSYAAPPYYSGKTRAAGIYSPSITLTRCAVDNNEKYGGAGIYVPAGGRAQIVESSISGNDLGIEGHDYMTLTRSTLADNRQYGMRLAANQALVLQSTVSGSFSGIVGSGNLVLASSTVANNEYYGIVLTGNLQAQSSIIAMNARGSLYPVFDILVNGPLTGADNLVVSTNASPPPGVITVTSDPKLLPLADNGGPTLTHALQADSPAINQGDNTPNFATDQRGTGFVRSFGRPDIGAYEWQVPGDEVFYGGFELQAR